MLEPSLEELGDAWQALREAWDAVAPAESIEVRYGAGASAHLRSSAVRSVLALAGFHASQPHRREGEMRMEARKVPRESADLSCTVVVPCRNEVDNVAPLVDRLPMLGSHTELIFVDGSSTDGTPQRIEELIRHHPGRDIKLLHQADGGKAAAVFQGFEAASGDVLMILDADMTVAPEDLPRFYLAVSEGVADFANGTRFVYPMAREAMPGANNLGNRAFSLYFSWLLRARISDTLCGTKALRKRDWPRVSAARTLFGGHDVWGDFDLLLGAAYGGLRIVDVPVRYGARVAGDSKMQPLRHGLSLGLTSLAGFRALRLHRGHPPPRRG